MKTHRILSILILVALAGAPPLLAARGEKPGEHGPRGWERFSERHDVNGDGQVTRDELARTLDLFDRMDHDGDGVLSENDFTARRTEMVFAFTAHQADADRDGELTAAEWDAWFEARDTDGDGTLSEADRAERSKRGDRARRAHRPHAELAAALDADGDGAVTRGDIAALAGRYDANGDGTLTADELPEVRHRGPRGHRGRHGGG